MAATLPLFPKVVFTLLEPLSLLAGFLVPILQPDFFISSQLPQTFTQPIDNRSYLLAWQLANVYLLLGLLGTFILHVTTDIRVVKAYLLALWLGDIGHIGITVYALGWEGTMDIEKWNTTVWFSVGFTVFLFLTRSAYFVGLFGGDGSGTGGRRGKTEVRRTKRQVRASAGSKKKN